MGLPQPFNDESLEEFLARAIESKKARDLFRDDKTWLAVMRFQWFHPTPLQGMVQDRRFTLPIPPDRGERRIQFASVVDSGRACNIEGYDYPVLHDLTILKIQGGPCPVKHNHDGEPIGHVESVVMRWQSGDMIAKGFFRADRGGSVGSGIEDAASREQGKTDWMISAGTGADKLQYVPAGCSVVVNWMRHTGPLFVVREGRLKELSVVPRGADKGSYMLLENTKDFNDFGRTLPPRWQVDAARIDAEKALLIRAEAVAKIQGEAKREAMFQHLEREQSAIAGANEHLREQRERQFCMYK